MRYKIIHGDCVNSLTIFRVSILLILLSISLFNSELSAQKKKLTYKQVYKYAEPRLTGMLPRVQGWLDEDYYLETKTDPAKPSSKQALMKVNAADGKSELFIDYSSVELPEGFSLYSAAVTTKDYSGFLFNQKNDLYYFNLKENTFKRLTNSDAEEKNPKFSPDGKKIAFTRSNNLFVYDIENEKETQLTTDGSASIYNGWASWVYYEEILGRASQYAAFWWSPNSEKIAFLRFDDNPVPEFPIYRADGQHGELEKQRYPKAGDPNPFVKLGIANSDDGKITWADFDEKADQYIAWPFWTKDSKHLTVQWMNRAQDNITIYIIDPNTGKKKELYNEKQPQWVEFFEDLYFFDNGSGFILRSDVDGYSHLYYYDMNGKLKKRLTQGNYSVADIAYVDEKEGKVYFHSSMQKSWDKYFYVVKLDGSGLKQLTTTPGVHACTVSPDGKYFYDHYSNITTPPKLDLFKSDGKFIRRLADSKTEAMDEYALAKVELFTISSDDGYDLPAIWFLPPDFDQNKKYPVLFSIYGGPATPSVRNSFPFTLEGYYFAQNGIIYISVDHRGSGHFGKKSVALMHRNLGKWEMIDYGIAVKWLKSKSFVDSTKIGIAGGSYGGYIAALALTKGADYFTHGIAEFGVMDWKLYDNVYTERYMDTPAENPEGYKNGSVLNYVDKYKGKLLITHGTMDDNVHMQNTLQLVYELEKLDKDFELMLYPNARHGIGGSLRNHSTRESVQFWFKNFLGRDLDINKD